MKPYFQDEWVTIYHGDCREILPELPKVDLVLTDPPYGTTACEWDNLPDLGLLWRQLLAIGRDISTYVFTTSQPFTTDLINSNRSMFRYEWVWNKDKAGNILSSNHQPMKVHENILIFYQKLGVFNKQLTEARIQNIRPMGKLYKERDSIVGVKNWQHSKHRDNAKRNPKSIINISSVSAECNNINRVHPTQKPIALFSYLMETYSNLNSLILDPFLGSGTTAYCAKKLNRKCIGIEIEEKYCEIAANRCRQGVFNLNT